MSKLFQDPTYEDMVEQDDWLNLTMQPYQWSLLEDFANIPDRIHITENHLIEDLNLHLTSYLDHTLQQSDTMQRIITATLFHDRRFKLFKPFEDKTYLLKRPSDIRALNIYLEKAVSQIPETGIREMASYIARRFLDETLVYQNFRMIDRKRLFEIHAILEAPVISKPVSKIKIRSSLFLQWETIIKEDIWYIRNIDLIICLTQAISEYIITGCPKSLKLISIVKCMTHKGLPIYSVSKEVL